MLLSIWYRRQKMDIKTMNLILFADLQTLEPVGGQAGEIENDGSVRCFSRLEMD